MKPRSILLGMLVAIPLSLTAVAQQSSPLEQQAKRPTESDRKLEAGRILLKWGGYVEKVEGQDRRAWAARMWPSLATADLGNLHKASRAVTYEGMRNALLGQRPYDEQVLDRMARSDATAKGAAGKALGSLASDLVFTPIAPCRIVDTRVVGGRIARNGTRNLIASNPAGSFRGQGGATTNCGIPANPAALALSVTGLSNTNTGYLRVFPANGSSTQGSPIPLNTVNTTTTNDIIVPACQACASDLKVFSTATTHYAASVTGYYMAPQATAPECYNAINETLIGPYERVDVYAQCAAGYSATGGGCYIIPDASRVISSIPGTRGLEEWRCIFKNESDVTWSRAAVARCCRTPGR